MSNKDTAPEDNEFLKNFQSEINDEDAFDEKSQFVAEGLDGKKKGPIAAIWDKVLQLWAYVRDPNVHWAKKALPLAGLVYLVSPIDLVPDFIPVAGLLDDAGVIGMIVWRLGAVLAAVGVAAAIIKVANLTADMLSRWIAKKKKQYPDASDVELLKERLESGNYVKCTIFDTNGGELESQEWETEKLDPELKKMFGRKKKIYLSLEEA
jgi:uncharacterized membrane protein YkvA (DUF1232 family)